MSKDSVLIVTGQDEFSATRILHHLDKMGQVYFRFDDGSMVKNQTKISLRLNNSSFDGIIELQSGESVQLASIKSVWFRRPNKLSAMGLYEDGVVRQFVEDEFSSTLRSLYTNLEQVFWMNHPVSARHMLEHNKLLQLKIAASAGLITPDTIITNNPVELIGFCEKHGGFLAVKALQSQIFKNADGSATGIYTNKISVDYLKNRKKAIAVVPLMAQEYVEKKLELRVTVVGKKVLACAIHSQDSERTRHDWRRYDFAKVKHEAYELPPDIQLRLLVFMESCNLSFGAIDMILTPEDKYVFLEVNPSGQFGWIEDLTGLPISESIAETLANCV